MRGTAAASGDFLKCTDDKAAYVKLGGLTYTGSNFAKPATATWDALHGPEAGERTLSKCDEVWELSG